MPGARSHRLAAHESSGWDEEVAQQKQQQAQRFEGSGGTERQDRPSASGRGVRDRSALQESTAFTGDRAADYCSVVAGLPQTIDDHTSGAGSSAEQQPP